MTINIERIAEITKNDDLKSVDTLVAQFVRHSKTTANGGDVFLKLYSFIQKMIRSRSDSFEKPFVDMLNELTKRGELDDYGKFIDEMNKQLNELLHQDKPEKFDGSKEKFFNNVEHLFFKNPFIVSILLECIAVGNMSKYKYGSSKIRSIDFDTSDSFLSSSVRQHLKSFPITTNEYSQLMYPVVTRSLSIVPKVRDVAAFSKLTKFAKTSMNAFMCTPDTSKLDFPFVFSFVLPHIVQVVQCAEFASNGGPNVPLFDKAQRPTLYSRPKNSIEKKVSSRRIPKIEERSAYEKAYAALIASSVSSKIKDISKSSPNDKSHFDELTEVKMAFIDKMSPSNSDLFALESLISHYIKHMDEKNTSKLSKLSDYEHIMMVRTILSEILRSARSFQGFKNSGEDPTKINKKMVAILDERIKSFNEKQGNVKTELAAQNLKNQMSKKDKPISKTPKTSKDRAISDEVHLKDQFEQYIQMLSLRKDETGLDANNSNFAQVSGTDALTDVYYASADCLDAETVYGTQSRWAILLESNTNTVANTTTKTVKSNSSRSVGVSEETGEDEEDEEVPTAEVDHRSKDTNSSMSNLLDSLTLKCTTADVEVKDCRHHGVKYDSKLGKPYAQTTQPLVSVHLIKHAEVKRIIEAYHTESTFLLYVWNLLKNNNFHKIAGVIFFKPTNLFGEAIERDENGFIRLNTECYKRKPSKVLPVFKMSMTAEVPADGLKSQISRVKDLLIFKQLLGRSDELMKKFSVFTFEEICYIDAACYLLLSMYNYENPHMIILSMLQFATDVETQGYSSTSPSFMVSDGKKSEALFTKRFISSYVPFATAAYTPGNGYLAVPTYMSVDDIDTHTGTNNQKMDLESLFNDTENNEIPDKNWWSGSDKIKNQIPISTEFPTQSIDFHLGAKDIEAGSVLTKYPGFITDSIDATTLANIRRWAIQFLRQTSVLKTYHEKEYKNIFCLADEIHNEVPLSFVLMYNKTSKLPLQRSEHHNEAIIEFLSSRTEEELYGLAPDIHFVVESVIYRFNHYQETIDPKLNVPFFVDTDKNRHTSTAEKKRRGKKIHPKKIQKLSEDVDDVDDFDTLEIREDTKQTSEKKKEVKTKGKKKDTQIDDDDDDEKGKKPEKKEKSKKGTKKKSKEKEPKEKKAKKETTTKKKSSSNSNSSSSSSSKTKKAADKKSSNTKKSKKASKNQKDEDPSVTKTKDAASDEEKHDSDEEAEVEEPVYTTENHDVEMPDASEDSKENDFMEVDQDVKEKEGSKEDGLQDSDKEDKKTEEQGEDDESVFVVKKGSKTKEQNHPSTNIVLVDALKVAHTSFKNLLLSKSTNRTTTTKTKSKNASDKTTSKTLSPGDQENVDELSNNYTNAYYQLKSKSYLRFKDRMQHFVNGAGSEIAKAIKTSLSRHIVQMKGSDSSTTSGSVNIPNETPDIDYFDKMSSFDYFMFKAERLYKYVESPGTIYKKNKSRYNNQVYNGPNFIINTQSSEVSKSQKTDTNRIKESDKSKSNTSSSDKSKNDKANTSSTLASTNCDASEMIDYVPEKHIILFQEYHKLLSELVPQEANHTKTITIDDDEGDDNNDKNTTNKDNNKTPAQGSSSTSMLKNIDPIIAKALKEQRNRILALDNSLIMEDFFYSIHKREESDVIKIGGNPDGSDKKLDSESSETKRLHNSMPSKWKVGFIMPLVLQAKLKSNRDFIATRKNSETGPNSHTSTRQQSGPGSKKKDNRKAKEEEEGNDDTIGRHVEFKMSKEFLFITNYLGKALSLRCVQSKCLLGFVQGYLHIPRIVSSNMSKAVTRTSVGVSRKELTRLVVDKKKKMSKDEESNDADDDDDDDDEDRNEGNKQNNQKSDTDGTINSNRNGVNGKKKDQIEVLKNQVVTGIEKNNHRNTRRKKIEMVLAKNPSEIIDTAISLYGTDAHLMSINNRLPRDERSLAKVKSMLSSKFAKRLLPKPPAVKKDPTKNDRAENIKGGIPNDWVCIGYHFSITMIKELQSWLSKILLSYGLDEVHYKTPIPFYPTLNHIRNFLKNEDWCFNLDMGTVHASTDENLPAILDDLVVNYIPFNTISDTFVDLFMMSTASRFFTRIFSEQFSKSNYDNGEKIKHKPRFDKIVSVRLITHQKRDQEKSNEKMPNGDKNNDSDAKNHYKIQKIDGYNANITDIQEPKIGHLVHLQKKMDLEAYHTSVALSNVFSIYKKFVLDNFLRSNQERATERKLKDAPDVSTFKTEKDKIMQSSSARSELFKNLSGLNVAKELTQNLDYIWCFINIVLVISEAIHNVITQSPTDSIQLDHIRDAIVPLIRIKIPNYLKERFLFTEDKNSLKGICVIINSVIELLQMSHLLSDIIFNADEESMYDILKKKNKEKTYTVNGKYEYDKGVRKYEENEGSDDE